MVTQKDQVVTGETAVFDTQTNLITMLGGVVLTQCKNVLRGDRLHGGHDHRRVAGGIRQRPGAGPVRSSRRRLRRRHRAARSRRRPIPSLIPGKK